MHDLQTLLHNLISVYYWMLTTPTSIYFHLNFQDKILLLDFSGFIVDLILSDCHFHFTSFLNAVIFLIFDIEIIILSGKYYWWQK